MEITTTIFIAGATFTLTETAHDALANYLSSLKEHFAHNQNKEEIIRDIEARIAEKLLLKNERIIVLSDTVAIISEIGDPSELEDQEESEETISDSRNSKNGYKKLYRDMDDAWIGGVASGIATYFDVNPLWVRGAFVLSTILWGASILVYIILWIIVPEAKNASQKLEMRGVPVSIHTISDMFAQRAEEVRKAGIIKKFFTTLTHFFQSLFKTFGKAIGLFLTAGSIFAIIISTITFGAILANWNSSFNDFPLRGAVSDNLIFLGMTAAYSVVLVPLILITLSGVRLIKKRFTMPTYLVLTLVGAWILVVIALGIIGVTIARHYSENLVTNPDYQIETTELELTPFSQIQLTDDNSNVIIKSGPTQSVTVRARAMEQNNLNIKVENGILKIDDWIKDENCFFCDTAGARVTITTPDLEKISVNRSYIQFEDYTHETLEMDVTNSSIRGSLTVPVLKINAEQSNFYTSIDTETLQIKAKDSYFRVDGSANTATLTLDNTSFGSELFIINKAETNTLTSDITATILEEETVNTVRKGPMEIDN